MHETLLNTTHHCLVSNDHSREPFVGKLCIGVFAIAGKDVHRDVITK